MKDKKFMPHYKRTATNHTIRYPGSSWEKFCGIVFGAGNEYVEDDDVS